MAEGAGRAVQESQDVDLSVVVVSFNTRAALMRTLSAVEADVADLRVEIVVVDNASDDGSVAAVREHHPAARLIENGTNRLYTAANNQGLAVARGRYVLVLNSDAEPRPGTLPALVGALAARPEVGLASCRLVWPDGRVQHNCARDWTFASLLAEHSLPGVVLPRLTSRARWWRTYGDWDRESERDVDVLPGSMLCASRAALRSTAGFDERFRLYFGEDDWCWRVRRAGYAVRYLPVGAVVHAEGTSTARVAARARRLYFDDMTRFAEARFGRFRSRLLRALVAPTALAQSVAARRAER